MTRHKHTHTGLVTPSPLDRWIDATLRLFAMLVQTVVSTVQMFARRPDVNATRQMPVALPGMKTDTSKEPHAVPQDSRQALMLSSTRSVRPSKHEGVLTTERFAETHRSLHAAILDAVFATKDFDGVLGKWSFDANGDTSLTAMSGSQVKGGKYEFAQVIK